MLEACSFGNGTATRKSSLSLRLTLRTAQHRRRTQRRRHLLLQQLEPRQMLAADMSAQSYQMPGNYQMPSSYQAGYGFAPTSTPPPSTLPYTYGPASSTAPTGMSAPTSMGPSPYPYSLIEATSSSPPDVSYSEIESDLATETSESQLQWSESAFLFEYETPAYVSNTYDYDYEHSTYDYEYSTYDYEYSTYDYEYSTYDYEYSTYDYEHSTYDYEHSTYDYEASTDDTHAAAYDHSSLAHEASSLDAEPSEAAWNAANMPGNNEPDFIPASLDEASFFNTAHDFWLPELAQWPTSPTSYQPTLIALPNLPPNLTIEEFPPPLVSVQATPLEARTAYDAAVATAEATHKQTVATAEAAHTAALAAAGANHSNAITSAALAKQAAIDGFTPQSLTALQQAVEAAEQALETEIERVKQQASNQLMTAQVATSSARAARDQAAENRYHNTSEAARSASANTISAIEHREIEAQERRYNNEITQAELNALSAALMAERRAEERRLAEELSGYRQIYDNALIEHEATERIEHAAAQRQADVQIAEAGRAQQATWAQARYNLAVAQTASHYGQQRTTAAANIQYQRSVAAAGETYAHAKADADAAKAVAIRTATAARSKANARASATLSAEIAHAAASSIITTSANDTSAAAVYRVAAARAERSLQVQQATALRDQQLAVIDADLALEVALLLASAERSKQDASANQVREQSFADAASRFRAAYFELLQQQADQASRDQIDAGQDRDAARREFDVDMAAVQQTRTTRDANELKPSRQAHALAQNKRDHNLISQESFLSETAALGRQARELRLAIAQDTFGSPSSTGASDSSAGSSAGTESGARETWLAKNNRAINELNQQQRARAVESTRIAADLSAAHDRDIAESQETHKTSIAGASLAANSAARAALQTWIHQATRTHAEYQSALAGAAAAHAVALSGATADFYTSVARNRATAIADFASAGDNPWAAREAAAAAADAARIASVATAYTTMANVSTSASATAISEAATAHATLIAETTLAQIDASAAVQAAMTTATTTMATAEQTRDSGLSSAVSAYDTNNATGHQTWRDIKDGAEFTRAAGYFGALLSSIYESLSVNPVVSAIQAARRTLEASIGTSYASTVVGAQQDYLITLAGENKDLHDAIAAAWESYGIAAADSNKDLEVARAEAEKTAASEIAAAQSAFTITLAGTIATRDDAILRADRNFTVSLSDAERTYANAITTADVTFDVAIAQRKRDTVVTWARSQRDAAGRIRPQAQYSIAVHDAALDWQRAAAPKIQAYRNAIANESHLLTVAIADANLTAGLNQVAADETFTIAVAGAEAMLKDNTALARQQRSVTFANGDATLARASSNRSKTFADAFATGRRQLHEGYANESASSELSLVAHRSQLHTQQISQQVYQTRRNETYTALMIALAGLDRDFAIERADAAQQWGHSTADDHHRSVTQRIGAAAAERHSIVDAHAEAGLTAARAAAIHRLKMAQLDAALTIAVVEAETTFDHGVALHWATLVNEIGQADVAYAGAVATAEVTHHIAVAEDAAQKLIDQSGSQPNQSQQFAIRVAQARTDFFRSVTTDYIAAITADARQHAEVNRRTADADAELQDAQGAATLTFVTTTQNALANGALEVATASVDYAAARWSDLSSWVRATVGADKTKQTTMAEVYQTAGRDYATAEAAAYRAAAELSYTFAQMAGNSGPTPAGYPSSASTGDFLDTYNRAFATLHFNIASAAATAGGAYGGAIASAQQAQASRLATAADAAVRAGSAAQHRLDVAGNDALRDLRNANDDAEQAHGRTLAQINRDHVVANAATVRDTLLAQYRAARDLYASFSGLTDVNVRYAVAQVRGAYAYAQTLLPHLVTTQTTIADANLSYAQTVIDAHREHRQQLTDAAHGYGSGIADAQQTDTDNRSGLWVTAVNAQAAALATAKTAIATAAATLGRTKATLQRDAAIAAGWGKAPRIDYQALARAEQAKTTATADALGARDNTVQTARDVYFRGLASAGRNAQRDAADRDHTFALAAIDSLAALREAEINAEFTAAGIENDARHDFRIADIDAVIVGLTAVRDDFNTAATAQARLLAVTSRDERVAAVNAERAAAQQRIANTQGTQIASVNTEKAAAVAEVSSDRLQRREGAQSLYSDATSRQTLAQQTLPHIVNSTPIDLGATAGPVPFMVESLTLVDTLTTRFTAGDSGGRMVTGVADELYVYTGVASAVDMAKYLIRAEINYQADRIRSLPHGDELVQYAGTLWSLTRQQLAFNAQGVRNWGQSLSGDLASWGAGGGSYQYGFGVWLSSLTEGGANLVAGLLFDPLSTAEGVAGVADAYYRVGGTLAVVGAFTGGLSLYESATGTDYLTGQALSGAERFDRGMLGTSAILTGIGTSGLLRNIATHGLRATLGMAAAAPKNVIIGVEIETPIRTVVNIATRSVDETNAPFIARGWNPPYSGKFVREFTLNREVVFARVHGSENKARSWMMRIEDVEGLTAAQIRDKFALPDLPEFISEVFVPAGTRIRVGKVAAQNGWGIGGAWQYELLERLPEFLFKNTRQLK